MAEKIIVGMDVGGTKIMTGLLTHQGKVIGQPVRLPTGTQDPPDVIVGRLYHSIERALSAAGKTTGEVAGIGIGVPGPLNIKDGVFLDPLQLPTLHGFPLRQTVREHYGLPVAVNNDANCFVLAESFFGAGVGAAAVLGFTLGTGFGCGIVIDRRIYLGATETAGEIWFSPYQDSFIEEYVSGRGLQRSYRNLTGSDSSPPHILEAAERGESEALQTWEIFGRDLAYALAWSINILDPNVVVLGGSLSLGFEFFAPAMERYLRRHVTPVPSARTPVVPGKLGESAGLIGAACLILESGEE